MGTIKGDGAVTMPSSPPTTTPSSTPHSPPPPPPSWGQLGTFFVVLMVDAAVLASLLLTGPGLFHYDDPGSGTWDLCLSGFCRVLLMLVLALGFDAYALSPQRRRARRRQRRQQQSKQAADVVAAPAVAATPPSPIRRMERLGRSLALVLTVVGLLFVMAKCLLRLIVGIGPEDSMAGFWLAVVTSAMFCCVDYVALKKHLRHVKRWAYHRHREALLQRQGTLQESLLVSLVVDDMENDGRPRQSSDNDTSASDGVEDEGKEDQEDAAHLHELWAGIQGLDADDAAAKAAEEGDSGGKGHATYRDLLSLARDDAPLIGLAFVFLLGAAIGQVLIPHYTGRAVDALVSDEGPKAFQNAMLMLVLCAAVCGVSTGLRGGIFTVGGARVNRRIRDMLFQSLLKQEVGFFDTTKTGDLSSRLSSDCTKVGDQVSLNVNFFLRSFVQAVGTLIFLFITSWKLSLVAFVSVPAIVIMSKVYGQYIRKLSKATQERLAQANSIAEECLSTMTTVRSFAAAPQEGMRYRGKLDEYYALNKQEARAYSAYAVATTLLPNLVTALVLFYGGQLVLNNDGMTSG